MGYPTAYHTKLAMDAQCNEIVVFYLSYVQVCMVLNSYMYLSICCNISVREYVTFRQA